MTGVGDPLAEAISQAVRKLPEEQCEALATAVGGFATPAEARQDGLLQAVPTTGFGTHAGRVLDAWERTAAMDGAGVALALRSATVAAAAEREGSQTEVVWTGPPASGVPVRLTSAVISDVAASAEKSLLVMTFAAYRVPSLVTALVAAQARGVEIDLVLESEQASGGKLSFDAEAAFGDVVEKARVWGWPAEKRPQLAKGHASLHAKLVLADERTAFVTSANMTGHGIDQNIELGLLIRGGPVPAQIARYVRGLMDEGTLARVR